MLEHRCSPRRDIALNAVLYHPRLGKIHCKTSNVGRGGAFLELASDEMHVHSLIKLDIQLGTRQTCVLYRMRCLVIHSNSDGIGLMFLDAPPNFYRTIQGLFDSESWDEEDAESAKPRRSQRA